MKWWDDASFSINPELKSHTGATIYIGKGSIYSTYVRQEFNKRKSIEADLVGVDDVMHMVLHRNYFLGSHVYSNNTEIFHLNRGSIILDNNCKASSGKRTRHINIKYFFVSDMFNYGVVDIKYCPIDNTSGGYFTKPLQGSNFG